MESARARPNGEMIGIMGADRFNERVRAIGSAWLAEHVPSSRPNSGKRSSMSLSSPVPTDPKTVKVVTMNV